MTVTTCSCCEEPIKRWVTLWSHKDILICYQCLDYLNARRAKQIATHGGLKPLAGYDPIFRVLDVERALDHCQRLGFTTEYHDEAYALAHTGATSLSISHSTNIPKHT
jgi:hypothetical protein